MILVLVYEGNLFSMLKKFSNLPNFSTILYNEILPFNRHDEMRMKAS
ncbi:hypothetical protein [Cytobacillus sp. FSL R5-0596]